ncbi:alpha/beta hydrolase [Streptomyces sp. NPDC059957]|uniref:alpha/beta hydrolase n=1 Tax=unclassified Streptomyces TaxID=2593676 RepID=UPI00365D82ED
MTDVTTGSDRSDRSDRSEGSDGPAPVDRLDPAARPYADAPASLFPDLGGRVTDAGEARRILAAVPGTARRAVVGAVEDREVPGPRPTVVFCHGGGWVLGDLDTYDATARALCRASGAVLVSVDYRRAPEARFPAAVHDAYAALCWGLSSNSRRRP